MGEALSGDVSVTVVVPLYNEERHVAQCLESVLADPLASMEVLVVNDGSTDGGAGIAHGFERKDERVRVIDKPNGGYGSAVNRGVAEARGTYVGIVEPDDVVDAGMFSSLLRRARTATAAGETPPDIVKQPYWHVFSAGTPDERAEKCLYMGRVRTRGARFRIEEAPDLLRFHPSIWSAIYRRGFLASCGIRFMELPGAGWVDNPFLFETMCQAESIVYDPAPHYRYREALPGSSSAGDVLLLALARWNDVMDVLDRLGVTDRGVVEAAVEQGLKHIANGLRAGALDDPAKADAIGRAFRRMPPEVVFGTPRYPVALKREFCRLSGTPEPAGLSDGAYRRYLARELAHTLRVNGPAYAVGRLKVFLGRRRGAIPPSQGR